MHRAERVLPIVSDDERAIAAIATEAIGQGRGVQRLLARRIKETRPDIGDKKILATLHRLAHGESRIFDTRPGANNAIIYVMRGAADFDDLPGHPAPDLA